MCLYICVSVQHSTTNPPSTYFVTQTLHGSTDAAATDAKFIESANLVHRSHKHYKSLPGCFVIKHYAGDVTYTYVGRGVHASMEGLSPPDQGGNIISEFMCVLLCSTYITYKFTLTSVCTYTNTIQTHTRIYRCKGAFVESNKDSLSPDLQTALASSVDKLMQKLFPPVVEEESSGNGRRKGASTASSKIRTQCAALVDSLVREWSIGLRVNASFYAYTNCGGSEGVMLCKAWCIIYVILSNADTIP